MNPPLLIGNGFATLVAAVELAEKGIDVKLLTDGKPLGGHFAGLRLDELDFDMGMVLLEEYPTSKPGADLYSYNPAIRNDWTRFGDRASAWIRSHVEIVRAPTPECLVEGRKVFDYLIADRLDGVATIGSIPHHPDLPRSHPYHASHKCSPGAYETLSYSQAAAANHGQAWHDRFIDPFVWKVFGVSSEEFLARFHRAAWAPLYYPETLRRASLGLPFQLTEYPFWTTPSGFVGQLVKNLQDKLSRSPHVSVITEPLASMGHRKGKWTISMADGQVHQSNRLAISLAPERAGSLLGVSVTTPTQAATVSMLFASVEASEIRSAHGCTMIVDEEFAAYRLTDQDALASLNPPQHRMVLEASPQSISQRHPGKTMELALMEELATLLGLSSQDAKCQLSVRMLRCITFRNILPIPTAEQVARAGETAFSIAQAAPGAVLTGSLLGFGVASLNDQVIQGLKISEEFA